MKTIIMLLLIAVPTRCEIKEVDDHCKAKEYYNIDGIEFEKCYD